MGIFVTKESFETGENQLSFASGQEAKLEAMITNMEKPWLCRILGIELAESLLSDPGSIANGIPDDADLRLIFDPLVIKYRREIRSSYGLVEILKGFVAAYYLQKGQVEQTTSGIVLTTGKNTEKLKSAKFVGYNTNMVNALAVQYYCKENKDRYPTFDGDKLQTIDPLW